MSEPIELVEGQDGLLTVRPGSIGRAFQSSPGLVEPREENSELHLTFLANSMWAARAEEHKLSGQPLLLRVTKGLSEGSTESIAEWSVKVARSTHARLALQTPAVIFDPIADSSAGSTA